MCFCLFNHEILSALGNLATIAMACFACYTIFQSSKFAKKNSKIQFHKDLREIAIEASSSIDSFKLNDVRCALRDNLDILQIKKDLLVLTKQYNTTFDRLNYMLIDRDKLYGSDEAGRWKEKIGLAVHPYYSMLGVLLAYCIFEEYAFSFPDMGLRQIINKYLAEHNINKFLTQYLISANDSLNFRGLRKYVEEQASKDLKLVDNLELDKVLESLYKEDSVVF